MSINRHFYNRRQASKDSFDLRMDQWIETGIQFVEGVSGARPGKRKLKKATRISQQGFNKVGRWVEQKLDWILEEEDSWQEPWQTERNSTAMYSGNKKMLDAVSRRGQKFLPQESNDELDLNNEDDWPDENIFKVEKWQRNTRNVNDLKEDSRDDSSRASKFNNRPLPRSSRKR